VARSRPASRSTAPAPSPTRIPWLALVTLIALGLAVYANALNGPFLLDDQRAIGENESIRQLWPLGHVLHPPVQSPVTGRPVPNLTFALNYAASGPSVRGFHATNIAIHILTGLAVFAFLRRTLPRMAGGEHPAPTPAFDLAAVAASALWLVHPINTETVNYVTQRTEALLGLFYVLTLWASTRALESRTPARWEALATLSAFCAVGSKEAALTLPLVLLLWDRAFAFGSFPEAWAQRKRLYGLILSSWLLFAYFARELPYFVDRGFQTEISRWAYLLHQGPIVLRYLWLTAWPQALVFDYGGPGPLSLTSALPAVAVVAALGVVTLVALVRWPRLGFWGAWFFITLAPASSFIPIPTEVGAERRMYLPLVALAVLVVWVARWLLARLPEQSERTRAGWALASVSVLALGVTTHARNRDYQDGLRIWQTSLERWPQPRAREHLSMFLRDAGRMDESIAQLRLAIEQSPNARHALASVLLERGELQESITHFREYLRQWPDDPHIIAGREEFGVALLQAKDYAGAAEQFRAIIAIAPDYPRARIGLGDALAQMNQPAAALEAYSEAVRLQPGNLVALRNLSVLQRATGDIPGAIATLKRVSRVEPRDVHSRQQLVRLLFGSRDYADAETELRSLLTITPEDPAAYNMLGLALVSQNRHIPARAAFEQALAIDPSFAPARENLARLR